MYQGDGNPTLYVAAHPRVGLISFRCEADGCAFKHIIRLCVEEVIHQHDEGVKVTKLIEAGLQTLLILIILCHLKTLLRRIVIKQL